MDLSRFRLIEISDRLSDDIWDEVRQWSRFNQDTIGKQFTRAADSISANLSEAYGRYTFPDRKRFSYIARGSLCETLNWIGKATRRELLDAQLGDEFVARLKDISFKLNYYIRSLERNPTNPS